MVANAFGLVAVNVERVAAVAAYFHENKIEKAKKKIVMKL